jgi:hypothetical protein
VLVLQADGQERIIKLGKQKEGGKKKKLSSLKRAILKDRAARLGLGAENGVAGAGKGRGGADIGAIEELDEGEGGGGDDDDDDDSSDSGDDSFDDDVEDGKAARGEEGAHVQGRVCNMPSVATWWTPSTIEIAGPSVIGAASSLGAGRTMCISAVASSVESSSRLHVEAPEFTPLAGAISGPVGGGKGGAAAAEKSSDQPSPGEGAVLGRVKGGAGAGGEKGEATKASDEKATKVSSGPVQAGEGKQNKAIIRPYCDQVLSEDLDLLVAAFLKRLHDFQTRAKERDIVKARMKKR